MVRAAKKIKKITAVLDETTLNFVEEIGNQDNLSNSEVIRRALNFYNENRLLPKQKIIAYLNLLSTGEHVIIDVDHWHLFLDFIQSSQDQEKFWTEYREIARFHAEELKNKVFTVEDLLNRLETCNLFKVIKVSKDDFTLILGSELPMKFITSFLEEFFSAADLKVTLKGQFSKINIHCQTTKC